MQPRHPYLFVYGTLKSTIRRNRFSRYLSRHAVLLGPATIPGRIYALRRYPAMRPPQAADDAVHGELHRLLRPELALAVLDAYEDRQYRRILREASLGAGPAIRCWVYEWKRPLPEHRRLAEGEWPRR